MHHRAGGVDRRVSHRLEPLSVKVDVAVGRQPRQPRPAERAQGFQVVDAGVPAVPAQRMGQHTFRLKTPLFGHREHRSEVVVFGEAVVGLVINPIVAGNRLVAAFVAMVRPQQRDEVDAGDDTFVFAGPHLCLSKGAG